MKKVIWMAGLGLVCIQLAGCASWTTRTSVAREPRVDQEISGNRGFIFGKPSSAPKQPAFTERKVYKVEVEIPPLLKRKRGGSLKEEPAVEQPSKGNDKSIWGNRGYIFGGPKKEKASQETPVSVPADEPIVKKIKRIFKPEPKTPPVTTTYKVKKGDTLQKISRKFYGTTKKWPLLYQVNKKVLKSPDTVYPGQLLVIPEAEKLKK